MNVLKNFARFVFLSFFWGVVCFSFFFAYFLKFFDFNILNALHWQTLYIHFFYLKWVIKERYDVAFAASLFLFPLFFLIGWRFVVKIHWKKFLMKPFSCLLKKEPEKKPAFQIQSSHSCSKYLRPKKMRTGGNLTDFSFLDKQLSPQTSEIKKEAVDDSLALETLPKEAPFSRREMLSRPSSEKRLEFPEPSSQMPMSSLDEEFKATQHVEKIKDIPPQKTLQEVKDLGKTLGFSVFENIMVKKDIIPLVFSYNEQAIALQILEQDCTEWIADEEEFDGDPPTWFTEKAQVLSPFYQLNQMAKGLEEDTDSKTTPVLVISKGTILNGQNYIDTWKEKGGYVARFHEGKPDVLAELKDVLLEIKKRIDIENQEKNE